MRRTNSDKKKKKWKNVDVMFTSDRELESYQRARDYIIIIVFHDRRYHCRRGTSP